MIQADYQLALLLQQQLEAETTNNISNCNDFHMAVSLQGQFEQEININDPKNYLVYDKRNSQSKNDSRSLVDPSWELIDPTPDIHTLFVAFNDKYFWTKLLAVSVSWSKRMTSCAGICTYNGRGGMCCITLSEPLLKLRPRKDLVETLLHEMIHAYLFVTNNVRDRDGHGPEFHKHMYRINKESGTNITVYHNFHDEVRLYKQHWWRCDGPCQSRKPFFGILRRATNRAPGPNDRWWDEHAQSCGGTFIKIREPEKLTKSKEKTKDEGKSHNGDIRKFVQPANGPLTNNNMNNKNENDKKTNSKSNTNNIWGFHNLNNSTAGPVIGNISGATKSVGFANLTKSSSQNRIKSNTKSNSSSTIVISKKPSTSVMENATDNKKPSSSTISFSGTGQTLQPPVNAAPRNNDYSAVRAHWLNKFENSQKKSSNNKRLSSDMPEEDCSKLKKPNLNEAVNSDKIIIIKDSADCPVCGKQVEVSVLNTHLDKCLELQNNVSLETCFICGKNILKSDLNTHQLNCFDNNFDGDEDDNSSKIICEICNTFISKSEQEEHTKACLDRIFNSTSPVDNDHESKLDKYKSVQATVTQCSVCKDYVDSNIIDRHIEKCLHKMYDEIENRTNIKKTDELISCLACSKKVLRSELNTHFDDCLNNVFSDKNEFDEISRKKCDNNVEIKHSVVINKNVPITKPKSSNDDNENYNCPFCLELYSELDIDAHIENCLGDDEDKSENKSLLVNSFSSDDF